MIDTQQGDVQLFQTEDDGEIFVENGIVAMSGGLKTSVYLALFGGNEDDTGAQDDNRTWWGNLLEASPAMQYRSETQNLLQTLPITSSNLRRLDDAVRRDLQYLLSENIASSLDVTITIPERNRVKIVINIDAEGPESTFEFIANWKNPAATLSTAVESIGAPIPPPPPPILVNSAKLNGSSQYFDAGNPAALQIPGNFSASIRVKFDVLPASSEVVFSKFRSDGNQRSWMLLYTSGTNQIRLDVSSDGGGGSITPVFADPPTAGVWMDILVVYNGSTLKIYADGEEEDSVPYSSGIFDSTADVFIGARDEVSTDLHLDGSTAFPRIWDTDLSAAQATELCNNGVPICTADLSAGLKTDLVYAPRLGNWEDNAGEELVDQSTSGITTTNVGSTPFTGTSLTVKCG